MFDNLEKKSINPLAWPSAGAPAVKYGDVNTVTPSPGEVKGLMKKSFIRSKNKKISINNYNVYLDNKKLKFKYFK